MSGVDPEDGKVGAVPLGELGEWCDADRAFPTEGDDPFRIVLPNHIEGRCELRQYRVLGLDPVPIRQAGIAQFDRYDRSWSGVLRQDRAENGGPGRVTAPRHLERELWQPGADALSARTLPLRPHQPQSGVVLPA
jgi:hypothetical protein